ncbi:patatin-like phospholipase family protein [Effusibacillus lacus]|uniref:Esterase n=1 Tax=Effusibacillus lacus TaxID=1348429 RepID=A0A292YNC2_9BACL|nr:patatin-like phospholipase family protein [Effusibacillus lacus]TCS76573.1 NTE family protein [Effusibacillus lacus]GAX90411.1 esterase [Effusibacillus lacus]
MTMPKIGLALGAGGARGLAHIGVLQVLNEAGIPVDAIAGSSMGALIGAFYVSGMETRYMEMLAKNLKRKHFTDFTVPKLGFVTGNKITEMIRLLTKDMAIEDAAIPFAVVATDVEKGERVVFRKGPIYRAVRSSISIPGVFVPYLYENRVLVDGGVIDRVPVSVCRELDVDLVIAVDVGLYNKELPVKNIFDVFFQSIEIMEREILKTRILDADIVIRPDVGHISTTAFVNVDECIEEGRVAARKVLDHIWQTIEEWKGEHAVGESVDNKG